MHKPTFGRRTPQSGHATSLKRFAWAMFVLNSCAYRSHYPSTPNLCEDAHRNVMNWSRLAVHCINREILMAQTNAVRDRNSSTTW